MVADTVGSAKLDVAAMVASGLCLVHCLALPLLLLIAPAVGAILALPDEFHQWAVAFAVPTSLLALLLGQRRHKGWRPTAVAAPALGLMLWGAFGAAIQTSETMFTVAGATMLAIAHLFNWRMASAH